MVFKPEPFKKPGYLYINAKLLIIVIKWYLVIYFYIISFLLY